jgi:aminoglycoside 3-N-acetyltransferase
MLAARTREYAELIPILERTKVQRDGILHVHSAIAKLSRSGFRAEAMIEALLDYMSQGTLVMPTMTWRTVTPEQPLWDEIETRSETGVMTEIFRSRYSSRRSIHPTHSVATHGAASDILVARHHVDDTPVSVNSPYGLMRGYATHVLMLGVGLETCTAIHLAEETIAPDVYLRPLNRAEIYCCKDRNGRLHNVHARRHRRLDRDFPRFGPPLAEQGRLYKGNIGECPYTIVGLNDLLETVTVALRADANGTLRHRRDPVEQSG